MQAERGGTTQSGEEIKKPSSEGPSDLSYSIDRWLGQGPREEPWQPFRR